MAREALQGCAGLALIGAALFCLYSGGEKVYRWCASSETVAYKLKSDRAVFESPNGRQEILIQEKTRKSIEQRILESEVAQKRALNGFELYQLYRALDANGDNVITPEEAGVAPVASRYLARE